MFKLRNRRKAVHREWHDGPVWSGGAGMLVTQFDDDGVATAEFDWHGRVIVEYDGEPRELAPGTTMPPAPKKWDPGKGEKPPELPPVPKPPPWPPTTAVRRST